MGIKVAQKSPRRVLRESLEALEFAVGYAGVGTIEVRRQLINDVVTSAREVLVEVEDLENEACDAWDEVAAVEEKLADEKAMVSHLQKQASNLKWRITKPKKRVDKEQ